MRDRWLLIGLVVLASGAVLAAPVPPNPPAIRNREELKRSARQFAYQLRFVSTRITDQYVRPLKLEDLLEAGLSALYRAVDKKPPRTLRAQLRDRLSQASMMSSSGMESGLANTGKPRDPVEELLVRLREELGDPPVLDGSEALVLACKGMARLLDAHSGVITAEDQRRAVGADNEILGVGLEFAERLTPGPMQVEQVVPGSPAQRAGMRPGDVVTHLDDQPVERADPQKLLALRNERIAEEVTALARPVNKLGPQEPVAPDTVRVTFRREGVDEARSALLIRERHRPESVMGVRRRDGNHWDFVSDEKLGLAHLRLTTLSRGTSEEVRNALATLRERRVRGLVLDLRWCPGGYLNEAVEVADLFLGTGVIATVKSRGREDTVYRSTDEGKFADFTLVVLINGDTSGGAELIAAALKDHGRAILVGQRTLGKASVQTPLSLGLEGVGFKLTSGTFIRPNGQNLHRFPDSAANDSWGVVPDEDCRLSTDLNKKLKQSWHLLSLRPVNSFERLPLDDPRADPQRLTAMSVLREQMNRSK